MENLGAFYQTIGGVAATLLGFLFLVVSNKSKEIGKSSYWNGNALLAFMVSLNVIVSSLVSLVGTSVNLPLFVYLLNLFLIIIQVVLLIKGKKERQRLMFADLANNSFISLCVVLIISIPSYFYFTVHKLFFNLATPYLMVMDVAWVVMLSWRILFMVENDTQLTNTKPPKRKK